MVDQDVKIKWKSEGADKAKADADKLAQAQKGVKQSQVSATKATADLTKAQEGLNASAGDYAGVLGSISPRLGAFVSIAEQAVKVVSNLATKQLSLRDITNGVASAMRNYGGAIKLAFAGGAALLAISRLLAVMRELKQETQAAVEAQERSNRKHAEAVTVQQTLAKQIEATSSRRRLAAGLTAEQILKEVALAQVIARKTGVSEAVAGEVVGEFSRTGATQEQLEIAAVARSQGKFDPVDPSAGAVARLSALESVAESRGAIEQRDVGVQRVKDTEQILARQARGGDLEAVEKLSKSVGFEFSEELKKALEKFGLDAKRASNAPEFFDRKGQTKAVTVQGETEPIAVATLAELRRLRETIAQLSRDRPKPGDTFVNATIRHQDRASQKAATRDRLEQLGGFNPQAPKQ